MSTVTLPQGTLHYRDLGPADAPAVVFVHGALVDGTLWRHVTPLVAERGLRTIAPDWPLGSHPEPMAPDADLSPRGVARMVIDLLARLDLDDVTLVANDSGGAITQFVLDTDARRVGRVVFTNCDTFERFPPPPFDRLFRLARLPGAIGLALQPTRLTGIRHRLGFGPLVATPLDADQTRSWLHPALTQAGVRRDFRRFLDGIDPADLTAAAGRLDRFDGPVLLAWAPEDRFFRLVDGRRLAACFRDARVVEIPGSLTFVPHDQPERLAEEIVAFSAPRSGAGRSPTPMDPVHGDAHP